jgi:hypothetical protein
MNDFIKMIFGNYSSMQMLGYLWFFLIGYIIYGLNETTGRDVASLDTPQKWNFLFWWKDNRKRYIATILSTYVLFIFYTKMTGHVLENIDCLLLGLCGDHVGKVLKDRVGLISANREELMKQHLDKELNKENSNQNQTNQN